MSVRISVIINRGIPGVGVGIFRGYDSNYTSVYLIDLKIFSLLVWNVSRVVFWHGTPTHYVILYTTQILHIYILHTFSSHTYSVVTSTVANMYVCIYEL